MHLDQSKVIIHAVCVARGQLIMTWQAKQFTVPQILSLMNPETLGTDVSFTNSLTYWPQRNCDKKASIETAWEQSVIVTSQLLAAVSCIDDVAISQCSAVFILQISGVVTR